MKAKAKKLTAEANDMANKLKTKKEAAKKAVDAAIKAAKEAGEELTHQELGAKDEAKTDTTGGNNGG